MSVSCLLHSDSPDTVEDIGSLPEQCRYGVNRLEEAVRPLVENGLKTVLIFGVVTKLDKVCACVYVCAHA